MSEDKTNVIIPELEELIEEYQVKANEPNEQLNCLSAEKTIFGGKDIFIRNLSKVTNEEDHGCLKDNVDTLNISNKRKPVWTDEDDEVHVKDIKKPNRYDSLTDRNKSMKKYLTNRFSRSVNQPKWAEINNKSKNEVNQILQTVGFLNKPARIDQLKPDKLHWSQLKDLNRETYAEGDINSVQFHPTSTVALVAGDSGISSIYCVDGNRNEKLHNMRFSKFPIKCSRLTPCGSKAFFGSSFPFYYVFDLISAKEKKLKLPKDIPVFNQFEVSPCGKYLASAGSYGNVHLLSATTNEIIHSFKQENTATGLCFTADSAKLLCNGTDNNINIFSLRQMRMEHRFIDDGCIKGKVIQLAPNQRLLATGSDEGVVNVYDYEKIYKTNSPLPEKTFMNLTTSISCVRFNHSSELLAMSSSACLSSVKLSQFPKATVFSNFPGFKPDFGKVNTIAFSPQSGFMAFGSQSKVPLFRLKHFENY